MRRVADAIRWSLAEWTPVEHRWPGRAGLIVDRLARTYYVLELGKAGERCARRGCPACASRWAVAVVQGSDPRKRFYRPMRDGIALRKGGRVRSFRSLDRAQGAILAIGFLECRALGTCRAAVV